MRERGLIADLVVIALGAAVMILGTAFPSSLAAGGAAQHERLVAKSVGRLSSSEARELDAVAKDLGKPSDVLSSHDAIRDYFTTKGTFSLAQANVFADGFDERGAIPLVLSKETVLE